MSGYTISKVEVWSGSLDDKPGGLAECLIPLADAGSDFEFICGRRDQPGSGLVFLAPVKGSKCSRLARKAGLEKSKVVHALRIEGPDRPGLSAKAARVLGEAGVNIRGFSGIAVGRLCSLVVAFDTAQLATKAMRILRSVL